MKAKRTAKQIIEELVQKADVDRFFVEGRSGRYTAGAEEKFREYCTKEVGQLILTLPETDRELLKDLTTDELAYIVNGYYRARPAQPQLRKRGPVTLGGRKPKQ